MSLIDGLLPPACATGREGWFWPIVPIRDGCTDCLQAD